jgi:Tfp pilus assembly protein PilO
VQSKRIKNLDRSCLAILVVAALGGLLWNGATLISQERKLQQDREREGQELRNVSQAEMKREGLRQALNRLQTEMAAMSKRVPPKTDMGALLKQLNLRMKERRITMVSIQPQAVVPEELHAKIPLRLVFQGTFAQVYHFFTDLETMDRLLISEKATITGLDKDHLCQVDLTVVVFERKTAGAGG